MVYIGGGSFVMGSDAFYPEEAPVHRVAVDGFWIDAYPVTNAQFQRFIQETGYVTVAERSPNPEDYAGALSQLLVPGSLVFRMTAGPVDLSNFANWWCYVPGASWRHPEGPGSTLEEREDHPVVQVAFEDAEAYAGWEGKELPTETEWEFAARGGLMGATYAWGDEFQPGGRFMANTWQGEFPWQNLALDGFVRTSPVESFSPNGYGLYDMIGNVWEWTVDRYLPNHTSQASASCCAPTKPRVGTEEQSVGPATPEIRLPLKVIKGGSHLCAPNYCRRYRPSARSAETVDTSTSHLGFRCVKRS